MCIFGRGEEIIYAMLVDFLFPKLCTICYKKGGNLCNDCFKAFVKINWVQTCHICGHEVRVGLVHTECKEYSHLDGLIYMSSFEGVIKKLIHEGKYNLFYSIFFDLGEIFAKYLKLYKFSKESLITFVPLYKSKESSRGFNQAEILAKMLAEKLNIPYCQLIERIKNTKTQVAFDRHEREQNLKHAFSFIGNKKQARSYEKVYIVDDVFTTGTTLNECAQILKWAGFKEVIGVTIARTGG